VLDNGSGIPEAALERLFEPFFTTKAVGQGTGLGLSICFGIMQACGGSITAANRPEGGAVFTLRLKPAVLEEFEEATEAQGRN
jgi:C4-dicarboxylate-specific signal transduction histidine kinase